MEHFFETAFHNMDDQSRESFYQTVFMNDPSPYAYEVRRQYYTAKCKQMGKNVTIGIGVKIQNPEYISLGDHVTIRDHATLIARGEGGIEIGDNVMINDQVYLDTESDTTGYIRVGKGTYIGTGTTMFGHKGLEIGENVLLAQNITLTPYSHHYEDPSRIIYAQGGHSKKVVLGNDVYVGMGVCIMYSGDIGEGSVVGAGSVVVKPIPPYSIAVGNPARVIRERK